MPFLLRKCFAGGRAALAAGAFLRPLFYILIIIYIYIYIYIYIGFFKKYP